MLKSIISITCRKSNIVKSLCKGDGLFLKCPRQLSSIPKDFLKPKKEIQEIMPNAEEQLTLTNEIIGKVNKQITAKTHGRLFAVVVIKTRQHIVTTEDLLVIKDDFAPTAGEKIRLEKVMCVGSSDFTLHGRPLLPKDLAYVEATVVEKTLFATEVSIKYLKKNKPKQFNNRDEFYSRPTKKAQVWESNQGRRIISGRDCEPGREGGIWLGASETGRISCLLNIFQPKGALIKDLSGRGFLACDFLKNTLSTNEYINTIKESNVNYNLFNLVLLDMKENNYEAVYYNNVDHCPFNLDSNKSQGFGNCLISNEFKKVEKGKKLLQEIVNTYGTKEDESDLKRALLEMMTSEEPFYPDENLINQGKGHDERFVKGLSSFWVTIPEANYGTRTTTIILVDANNQLSFHERTMETPSADCTQFSCSDFTLDLKTS